MAAAAKAIRGFRLPYAIDAAVITVLLKRCNGSLDEHAAYEFPCGRSPRGLGLWKVSLGRVMVLVEVNGNGKESNDCRRCCGWRVLRG